MRETFAFVAAFFLGSIPSAYLWVRLKTGKDIRTLGSGNVGATNVFRCVGRADGIAVLILDAAKGIAGVLVGGLIYGSTTADLQLIGFGLGCTAILGHVFTPWLRFKGGKGVATGAGVALAVYPTPFLLAFLVWASVLKMSRYMSLASIVSAYIFAASVFWLIPNKIHALITLFAAFFITWTHRANLARLRQGTEPKLFHK